MVIFVPLVAVELVGTVTEMVGHFKDYTWLLVGIAVFFIADRIIGKERYGNFFVFSHELDHAVVSVLLFKKVHSFRAGLDSGEIYHTAGGSFSKVLISLAPYCLPLYTYAFLLVRAAAIPSLYWLFDLLIGISLGFYAFIFRHDARSDQPDINQYSTLLFPYLYIAAFQAFNLSVILRSLLQDKNVFKAFADIFVSFWQDIVAVFTALF